MEIFSFSDEEEWKDERKEMSGRIVDKFTSLFGLRGEDPLVFSNRAKAVLSDFGTSKDEVEPTVQEEEEEEEEEIADDDKFLYSFTAAFEKSVRKPIMEIGDKLKVLSSLYTTIVEQLWALMPESFDLIDFMDQLKESDLFKEGVILLQMTIKIGVLEKFIYSYKGVVVVDAKGTKDSVTMFDYVHQCMKVLKRLGQAIYNICKMRSVAGLFNKDYVTKYDEEFSFLTSEEVCMTIGRGGKVDDETFDRRLHDCHSKTIVLMQNCKQSERAYYASRLNKLSQMQVSRTLSKKESIRVKPYGALFYGESGVGKSAVVNSVLMYCLQVNGKDYDPAAIVTLNPEDKFQSEFMTHHKAVILDDLCNANLKYTDGSPLTLVIMLLNQVGMAALNPNAEMKGKIMMEPDFVLGTTNVKDLKSNELSNEPLSICRRFESTITQVVKPQYRREGTMMLDPSKIEHMAGLQFPTYAVFTVEEPYYRVENTGNVMGGAKRKLPGESRSVCYRPREFDGKPLVNVEIDVLLDFLKEDTRAHFIRQTAFVEHQRSLRSCKLCAHEMPYQLCKECVDEEDEEVTILETQAGSKIKDDIMEFILDLEDTFFSVFDAIAIIFLNTSWGKLFLAYKARENIHNVIFETRKNVIYALLLMTAWFKNDLLGMIVSYIAIACVYATYLYFKFDQYKQMHYRYYSRVPRFSERYAGSKMRNVAYLVTFLTSMGWLAFVAKFLVNWKKVQFAKPIDLAPDAGGPSVEKEFWDTPAAEKKYLLSREGMSEASATLTVPIMERLVGNKLLHMVNESTKQFCNALPLKGNVLLIPNHAVPKETELLTFMSTNGHLIKGVPISKQVTHNIPGTDFAVFYAPAAGVWKDITDYYPMEIPEDKEIVVSTVYNEAGCYRKYADMIAKRGRVYSSIGSYQGLNYEFPEDTFGGLCMATMIGRTRDMTSKKLPFIAGHHLCGGGKVGGGGILTRTQIVDAINVLGLRGGVLIAHSATPFATKQMGVDVGPLTDPHSKCTVNELKNDAKIIVHGAHKLPRSTQRSGVVKSSISDSVASVMGIPRIHGPPKDFDDRRHKLVNLESKVDTASRFDVALSNKACEDYSKQLLNLPASEIQKLGKISDDVNLSGHDGVIGINSMNFSTSMGFPLKGPKDKYVSISERKVEGITVVRDVDTAVLDAIHDMEQTLLKGQRINAVFKGSLKDEPVALNKDKVRVFAGAPMAFTMLVRKYFLTSAALFQRNKEITECAVGIVVQSPEWGKLFEHIGKFGDERAIAGDYSKFDARMSSQFMLMAFKILIQMAEKSGNYDADDLIVMHGIATEISYPTYDWFGTLVGFSGSNPSGHPLTVIINSMVNSLYMRYAYFAIAKKRAWLTTPLFKDAVALMTYGDDNIATVKKGCEDFNHSAIVDQFALVDMKYTMADKDAESVPFIKLQDASFLKHFCRYDEELGVCRSEIELDSLAKMLHTHKRSSVLTMKESSVEAIKNASLKYFEFGEEEYTLRNAQLMQIVQDNDLNIWIPSLPTYAERVEWYREKFGLNVP